MLLIKRKRQCKTAGCVSRPKGVALKTAIAAEKREYRGHFDSDGRLHGGRASELVFEG